jgi:hypothetical protein
MNEPTDVNLIVKSDEPTLQQKLIDVAEWAGWSYLYISDDYVYGVESKAGWKRIKVPDWANSLDALQPLVEKLNQTQRVSFLYHLKAQLPKKNLFGSTYRPAKRVSDFSVCNAVAPLRLEALWRTIKGQ